MKKILIISLLCTASFASLAQEDVEEVIVTSSLTDANRQLSEIGDPVHIVSGEDLEDGGTKSLGESIDDLLGVSSVDYGAAVGQPAIRGLLDGRVKILRNGLSIADVSGMGADHLNEIDLFNVSQIEIIRGPSSLLYAKGALGGVINVIGNTIAKKDFKDVSGAIGLEFQTVNEGDSKNFAYENNVGGINLSLSYKDSEFGNYDIPNGAILHSEEEHEEEGHDEHEEDMGYLANSDFGSTASRIGLSRVGEWGYFGISLEDQETTYGIPFHGDEHGEEHGDEHEGEDEEEHGDEHEGERIFAFTESQAVNMRGGFNINGNLVNSVDFFFRDTDYLFSEQHDEEEHDEEEHEDEGHEDEHGHEEGPTIFTNDTQEFGAIFDLVPLNGMHSSKIMVNFLEMDEAILGAEAFMNPVQSEEFNIGYYLGTDLPGGFDLDLGLRYDSVNRKGSVSEHHEEDHDEDHGDEHEDEHHEMELEYFDNTYEEYSFAASLRKEINDSVSFDLSFSSVANAPSSINLAMNGPHLARGRLETGDVNLVPERGNNFEGTLFYDDGNFFGQFTAFQNNISDYIYLQDMLHEDEDHDEDHHDEDHDEHEGHDDHGGNLIPADFLQQDADFNGYEFEFGRRFILDAGELEISFGRDVVNGEFSNGENIPRITPARNLYSISYSAEDLRLNLTLKDVEAQKEIGDGETLTEGFQMLNFVVGKNYNLASGNNLRVSAFANNILDEVARNHASYVKDQVPLPGLNFGVKFRLDF